MKEMQIKLKLERRGLEMDVNRQDFALALKTWRLRQGLSQREVGDRFGCSRYTIIRAETAKALSWESAYKLFAKLAKEQAREIMMAHEIHNSNRSL